MKTNSQNDWQYSLPCAFFDGENSFLCGIQGWERTIIKDIVSLPHYFWNRKSYGTAVDSEKWAVERAFYHEKSNLLVMTFDILDNGISYMVWWLRGNRDRNYGTAVKINGRWHVVREGEELIKDFDSTEKSGIHVIEKVRLKIFSKISGNTLAETTISRSH